MSGFCRKAAFCTLLSGFVCLSFAFAEPPEQPPGAPPMPGQGPGRGPGGRMMRPAMWSRPGAIERLLDSMKLDDAQRKAIDAKVAEVRDANKDKINTRPTPEQMTKMRELQDQLREARKNQDTAKATELQSEMMKTFESQRVAREQM